MKYFDLTTKEGLDKASNFIGKYIEYTPYGLAYKLAKWIFDSDTAKKQNEVIKDLIEKGKTEGVKEMDIKANNTKEFRFDIPLEEGVKVGSSLGSDETITIHVEYK